MGALAFPLRTQFPDVAPFLRIRSTEERDNGMDYQTKMVRLARVAKEWERIGIAPLRMTVMTIKHPVNTHRQKVTLVIDFGDFRKAPNACTSSERHA